MPAKMKLSQFDLLQLLESPGQHEIASGFRERSFPNKALICTPNKNQDRVFILIKWPSQGFPRRR